MAEPQKYVVKIDDFEGPFDLLLYLVKNSKINISELLISEITRQYVLHLETYKDVSIDETSNFIFTASMLLYWKSRALIPREIALDEEDDDDRRDFIESIIEYQKYKATAQLLRQCIEQEKVLIRKEAQLIIDFKDNENWEEISIMDLIIAFSKVAREVDKTIFKTMEVEEISIDEKLDEIIAYVSTYQSITFSDLFPAEYSKYLLIITFLALLELVKMKKVYILQHKLFGTIKIVKREDRN